MKLSVKGLAVTSAVVWGAAVFVAAAANIYHPTYALSFLNVIDSIYPGYHAGTGWGSVLTGTGYAVFDGATCGAVFAWIYNKFS